MTHPTSTHIAGRIEDLYGAPLADLTAHAQEGPPGMLAALLGMHGALDHAERVVTAHRGRLAQLFDTERQISSQEVSHALDCVRRLAEAVAVRDVQATTAFAVLQSLGPATPHRTAPPVTAAPTPPAATAAPSR